MNVASTSNTSLTWKKKWRRSHDMTGPLVPTTPNGKRYQSVPLKMRSLFSNSWMALPSRQQRDARDALVEQLRGARRTLLLPLPLVDWLVVPLAPCCRRRRVLCAAVRFFRLYSRRAAFVGDSILHTASSLSVISASLCSSADVCSLRRNACARPRLHSASAHTCANVRGGTFAGASAAMSAAAAASAFAASAAASGTSPPRYSSVGPSASSSPGPISTTTALVTIVSAIASY